MTITYALNITELQVAPQAEDQTDVVINVGWAYVGTDGTNSASFGGTTALTYTQGNPFTPYNQLTMEQVSGWVLGAWTPDQTAAQQDAIAAQLALVSPPLPWAPPEPASATPAPAPAV